MFFGGCPKRPIRLEGEIKAIFLGLMKSPKFI